MYFWIYFNALLRTFSPCFQSCSAHEKESWRQQAPLANVSSIWKSSPITTLGDVSTADRFTLVSTLIGAKKSYSLNKLNLWRGSSVFHVPSSSKKTKINMIPSLSPGKQQMIMAYHIVHCSCKLALSVSTRTELQGQQPPHVQISFINPFLIFSIVDTLCHIHVLTKRSIYSFTVVENGEHELTMRAQLWARCF